MDETLSQPARARSVGARLVRGLVALALVVLLLELFSFVAHGPLVGERFSFTRAAEVRAEVSRLADVRAQEDGVSSPEARFGGHGLPDNWPVLHPYFGFGFDPRRFPERFEGWVRTGGADPFRRSGDEVRVVLLGGSVAFLFEEAWPTLARELGRLPRFAGKELVLISLATPGFKQPQQLQALTYWLARGGEADLVLNLDGFNEIGLELAGIVRRGVEPTLPRIWQHLATEVDGLQARSHLEGVYAWRRLRGVLADGFEHVSFSVTMNLVWRLADRALAERQSAEETALAAAVAETELPMPRATGTEEDSYRASIAIWRSSSELLFELARERGFDYVHALQPNQYVEGSKPFSAEEEERFRRTRLLADSVARWYPELAREGEELSALGVTFLDLRDVFGTTTETVYMDTCCHVNALGNEVLATTIGRLVVDALGVR